jgi:hypothetical protein
VGSEMCIRDSYRNGGILQYTLRQMAKEKITA